ncbi:hypothetical protein BC938DRAFT_479257 [Jimgerdemannia flammicorona]|uniref:HECT-type E3 ubiquitin transferase n=1 Tax=Jimgerdemannia flammicorona TaxID=994334 RepID=A0A433QL97_9FUNG|nr:hypothetical protein BC938DRAFT_479257 [Jimgerdemannia flammicorona]
MVDEEGDEDEESETGEDDEGDLEENDGAVLEDMEHEMPDDRFGMPFELGAPVALDDEIGGWARAHRSFINLGTRRHGRALPGRRAVFEVPMHGEGSFNMWGGDSVDAGRFSFFDESAEFQIVGRPFSRTPGSWNDDIATHPLLANRTTGLPTAAGGALDAPRLRPTRSSGLNEFQAFEEMIGGSAVQLLETLLNRHPRPGMHPLPGAYRVEVNNGPGGIVSGIELDRLFSRPPTSGQDAGNRTTPADPFAALQDFSPMTTAERWHQESRMMYGNTMTDKALRLVDPVLNVLLPLAIEEEKKRKEKEEKEREEQRLKVEVDRKAAEELQQRLKEEADRKSEEAAREHPSQLTEVPVEDAQTTTLDVELGPEGVMDVQMTDDEVSLPQEMDTFVSSAEMDLVPAPTTQLDNVPAAIAEMEEAGQAAAIDTEDTSAGSSAVTASAPTTVLINGTPVDISGTGIDPTFLEALPDDLRQEVLNQHFRERRTTTQATETAASISPEFLDALPPDIREEVLQQEALERERRERQQQTEAQPAVPVDLDPASFLASLDPILRETVLMEQDETFLATLPPALVAEANAVRARASRRYVHQSVRQRAPPVVTPALPVATPKKPAVHRDAVQLVDRAQLATLVRLLFLPQSISKNLLNRLLLNLCENSRTRGDLISLLLSILQDGSGDLAAVDKSFAQMSLRPKVTPKTPKKLANQQAMSSSQNLGENVPNLIAQRCLEALTCIVQYNEQSINYFLSENDNITTLKRFSSKKGKGKEKSGTSRYPIVVLLSLLDRDIFTKNTALMDQLMHLLCAICRPLSSLAKKEEEKDAEKSNTSAAATVTAVPAAMATVATTAPESTVTNSASSTANSVEDPPPSISSENNIDAGVTSNPTNSEAPAAESSKPAAKDNDKEKSTLKPPVIPEQYLRLVVHVLTAGECSSKTFQSTLTVIQHLSALEGARYVITDELVDSARNLGEAIHEDLKELIPVLENAMTGVDVQGATLSKFSPSSSQQAKLLRVLKNIDYMYTRKQQTSATAPVAHPPTAVETPTAGAPTVAETEEADGMMARTLTGDGKSTGYTFTEDEEKVLQIYDGLSFTPLWQKLGHCLTLVHEKEDMVHVATVLLPLIESFMVVSKYVGIKGPSTVQKAVTRGSASPRASLESHEDLFFAFTEEHRKILNTMVRNNPSLMSGSFSLLVRNPKMLEFDNKRNYFTQQLHKRTNVREHYNTVQLNVRRPHVFEDSFHQLQHRSGEEIKYGKLSVRFYDEEGVDAGGVTREWFSVLARQMFNPDYALFKTSAADKLTYQPNRASWVNSDHLSFFKFVGRVIGKAIYDGRLLDAYFTRSFYKHILGRPVDYKDVEAVDPEYYKSLVWMLDNDITDIMDLTFSVETDDFGKMKTVDLKPNGREIAVTEENKQEYVKLVSEQKLTLAIKDQIKSFLDGFHAIIPPHLISIFNEQELELLISGLPDIDIDDWKNTTEYQGYTSSSPQVQWFWRAVRSFDQEERAKLLQFATGTSKVPLEGFTHLQGVNGVQKFQIHKDYSSNGRLPSAHTW